MMWKKLVDGFLLIVFLAFTVLQLNDPDSVYWVAIYGFIVVIVLLAMLGKQPQVVLKGALIVYFLLLIYYSPALYSWIFRHHAANIAQSMSTEKMYIEEAREFFGVLLCFIIIVFEYYFGKTPDKVE